MPGRTKMKTGFSIKGHRGLVAVADYLSEVGSATTREILLNAHYRNGSRIDLSAQMLAERLKCHKSFARHNVNDKHKRWIPIVWCLVNDDIYDERPHLRREENDL